MKTTLIIGTMLMAHLPTFGAYECQTPMMTPWGEKVTAENAWREYPRPQMVRSNWTCLNGEWDYQITSVTNTMGRPKEWAGKIRVPFALEAPLSGCGGRFLAPDEYLWYTREIELDPKPGERTLLHFGAVDFRAIVYLGHDEVAIHEGGNLPFTVDLTQFAKRGANTLTVLVWDPTEDFIQSRGKQVFKSSGGFYTRVSGIWQTVWLEAVPERHIADYDVTTDIDKGEVTLELRVESGKCRVEGEGTVEIENPVNPVQNSSAPRRLLRPLRGSAFGLGQPDDFVAGASRLCVKESFIPNESITIKLPAPVALWSPEEPNLYHFTARYGGDEIKGYFAMRKFEKRKDAKGVLRFFLNNEPYYVMATLDQGWWPDGLLTPPSDEAMAFDIRTLKDCGFNAMRKHIKVEPLRYYALCDRMGILVLQDMPSSAHGWRDMYDPAMTRAYGMYRAELRDMIDHLRKVPSIVMWVPYNEGWSQPDWNLTHTTLDFVRRYDPTRLVCGPSGHNDFEGGVIVGREGEKGKRTTKHLPFGECEAADVVDVHAYRGPGMPPVNERRVSFLGEFGGLGHRVDGHYWGDSDQGRAVGTKKGVFAYGGMKDTSTREGLEKTYLGLIEKLGDFAARGLSGSVYTQTTDIEHEINGLMTYDRKVLKYDPAVLRAAHEAVIRRMKGN